MLKLQMILSFFFSFLPCTYWVFVMSQNALFNENSQKFSFENTSHDFTLGVCTNHNEETSTHSADSLNLTFSDSDHSCKKGNADLDFEALISTGQYIDLFKLDDFVNDEIFEGKLLP